MTPQIDSHLSDAFPASAPNVSGISDRSGTVGGACVSYYPTLEQTRELAQDATCRMIPVTREIYADIATPIEVLRVLKHISRHCYMLESIEDNQKWGRYTFLGYDPTLELTCLNGHLTIKAGSTPVQLETTNPGPYIRDILADNHSVRLPGLPPFTGGLVGYFSYDYMKYAEPQLSLDAEDTEGFKDVDLMLFDKVIAFDHFRQKIILIVNASVGGDKTAGLSPVTADAQEAIDTAYYKAVATLDEMARLIQHGTPADIPPGRLKTELQPLFDQAAYCQMVETAKRHIYEGDIFQVVLSNRLEAEYSGSLFNTYRVLRTTNPSPYMFYFSSDDIELAGASPETLVKLEDGVLHTFPLAGTRPRSQTEAEDQQLEEALLHDPKELAEHNMLVDLGRNDLGKISRFGSVEVEKYCAIERFSHVMHIGSTVRGELAANRSAMDAIEAVLPAGTLSGAPKFRACEIINTLENNKRGIYGGAIGYLDFTGNLDTCIAIRLVFRKNGKVFVRSGAGIVADSVPEKEYRECIQKAAAMVNALHAAEKIE